MRRKRGSNRWALLTNTIQTNTFKFVYDEMEQFMMKEQSSIF